MTLWFKTLTVQLSSMFLSQQQLQLSWNFLQDTFFSHIRRLWLYQLLSKQWRRCRSIPFFQPLLQEAELINQILHQESHAVNVVAKAVTPTPPLPLLTVKSVGRLDSPNQNPPHCKKKWRFELTWLNHCIFSTWIKYITSTHLLPKVHYYYYNYYLLLVLAGKPTENTVSFVMGSCKNILKIQNNNIVLKLWEWSK